MASTHTEHHLAVQDPETETAVLVMEEAMTHLMALPVPKMDFYLFPNLDMSVVAVVEVAAPMLMVIEALPEKAADMVEMAVVTPALQPKTMVIRVLTDTVAVAVAAARICPTLALAAVAAPAALPSECT